MEIMVAHVTLVVTWLLGFLAKKNPFINNNLIIMQNIFIGIISAAVYYAFTKDFSTAIAMSGIFADTSYNLYHNICKLIKRE